MDQAQFGRHGIVGDRAYALIDAETGKVVSAKSVKRFPDLLMCGAVYLEPPQAGKEIPPVQITLTDGTKVNSDSPHADQVLSDFFNRKVRLARVAPDDFTIDPRGHRDTSPIPAGSFMDAFPVSVITSSTLDRLSELKPEINFDVRRFRMNVVVKTVEAGFVENQWVGKKLSLGKTVSLGVTMPDARCVMTTMAQEDLPKDARVLKTLVEHNSLDVAGSGKSPCAGVYAVIGSQGLIRVNDSVELLESS